MPAGCTRSTRSFLFARRRTNAPRSIDCRAPPALHRGGGGRRKSRSFARRCPADAPVADSPKVAVSSSSDRIGRTARIVAFAGSWSLFKVSLRLRCTENRRRLAGGPADVDPLSVSRTRSRECKPPRRRGCSGCAYRAGSSRPTGAKRRRRFVEQRDAGRAWVQRRPGRQPPGRVPRQPTLNDFGLSCAPRFVFESTDEL